MNTTVRNPGSAYAGALFGALVAASALVRLAGGDPVVAAWLAFVGVALGPIALIGIYGSLVERSRVVGFVAFVVAIFGLALSLGQLYALTFTSPGAGPLGPFFPLGYGPFLFGLLLLDVVIIRSHVVWRGAAVLLILGAVMNAAGFATVEIRLLGVVLFGLGFVWLGLGPWAVGSMRAVRAPAAT